MMIDLAMVMKIDQRGGEMMKKMMNRGGRHPKKKTEYEREMIMLPGDEDAEQRRE